MIIDGVLNVAHYDLEPEILAYEPCGAVKGTKLMATLMYKGTCSFACKYCLWHTLGYHDLPSVNIDEVVSYIQGEGLPDHILPVEKVESFLVSGMEPTQFDTLIPMLEAVRETGVAIRLDTNGTNPDVLAELFDKKLLDYVAMDVKAPPAKYELVTQKKVDIKKIEQSIKLVKENAPMYKFRTTACRELLTIQDILEIADWLGEVHAYEVKDVWDSPKIIGGKGQYHPLEDKAGLMKSMDARASRHVDLKGNTKELSKDKRAIGEVHFPEPRKGLGIGG